MNYNMLDKSKILLTVTVKLNKKNKNKKRVLDHNDSKVVPLHLKLSGSTLFWKFK